MKDLVNIELPFSGFYESWHSEKIDDAVEQAFSDDHGDVKSEYQDAIWEANVNWQAIREEYAKNFVEDFGREFELDLQFQEMTSPAFYNFSTDRIFASIPRAQIDNIRHEVEALPQWPSEIRERFTSYDGFFSHYSNDYQDNEWTRATLDECQYLVILEVWIDNKHKTDPNNNHELIDIELEISSEMDLWSWNSFIDAVTKIESFKKQGVKK